MNDAQIISVLNRFSEDLELSNLWDTGLRLLGWLLIKGLAVLVDSLENVTDSVLGLKSFFNSAEIQAFIQMIRPGLWILLAFSFLFIGYMFIMNKKVDRAQIIVNIFVSISVLVLLGTGMTKVDKFTDSAIAVVDYKSGDSLSDKIIKDNILDLAQLDANGWKEYPKEGSKLSGEKLRMIEMTETIEDDFEVAKGKKLSEDGQKIIDSKIGIRGDGTEYVEGLTGLFKFDEAYYRWSWNFWTLFVTLAIMGLTLTLVSMKLVTLAWELAFNYILATIIAPADVINGQKLKQVLMNILNSFMVIIMIFISLKLYMMGTLFITDKVDGIAYIIALAMLSFGVINGPTMCERIFGIDAGVKSGWGMLAGAATVAKGLGSIPKMAAGLGNGLASMGGAIGSASKTVGGGVSTAVGAGAGIAKGFKDGATEGKESSGEGGNQDAKVGSIDESKGMDNGSDIPTEGSASGKDSGGVPLDSGKTKEENAQSDVQKQGIDSTVPPLSENDEDTSGSQQDIQQQGSETEGVPVQDSNQEKSSGAKSDMNAQTNMQEIPSDSSKKYGVSGSQADISAQGNSQGIPSDGGVQGSIQDVSSDVSQGSSEGVEETSSPSESRTIGQYVKENTKEQLSASKNKISQSVMGSKQVLRTEKAYQLGQNTGKNWRNIAGQKKEKVQDYMSKKEW